MWKKELFFNENGGQKRKSGQWGERGTKEGSSDCSNGEKQMRTSTKLVTCAGPTVVETIFR